MKDHWTLHEIMMAFYGWLDKRKEPVGVIINRQRWLDREWAEFEKHLKEGNK